ncbi:hypothetical protein [Klebsiella grimontii]|uniref:hypothetical protein n=1 Tax=Klebsiella grimontii TaxID=2058152 RepID=UPI001F4CD323|nr:hypothetical protein [Klebsiella grimontii]MDT8626093.1 hypothetical protein [Klebsiella grimontii]UNF11900.1 hypothetical protein L6506_21240 [Klebsiella grimontii]
MGEIIPKINFVAQTTEINTEHTDYGLLFKEPAEETDGDIVIDLEHLSQELKLAAIQILLNQIDRETAEENWQKSYSNLSLISPQQNCQRIFLNRAMPDR